MTTYKEGPVYAELLMSCTDGAFATKSPFTPDEVLSKFSWMFKGGSMVEAMLPRVASCSLSSYPNGSAASFARSVKKTSKRIEEGVPPEGRADIIEILTNRREARPLTRQAAFGKVANFVFMTYDKYGEKEESLITSGLPGVMRVFFDLCDQFGNKPLRPLSDRLTTYLEELLVGSSASSFQDVPTIMANMKLFQRTLQNIPVEHFMEYKRTIDNMLKACQSTAARDRSRKAGSLIDGTSDPLRKRIAEEVVSIMSRNSYGPDYTIGKYKFHVFSGGVFSRHGKYVIGLSVSDLKRLGMLCMSTASIFVAASAQACTGSQLEREYGPAMVRAMAANLRDMVELAEKCPVGDEVQIAKGLKRAFSVYLADLSGPLCAQESRELMRECIEGYPAGESYFRRWVERCHRVPDALGFNIGKVYKILVAPDAAPGGTVIDRLKSVAVPNSWDPVMMQRLEHELTDQIVWARMLKKGMVKLTLKPGVAQPTWWNTYRAHGAESIPTTGLRDIVQWENSAQLIRRHPFDPSVWKDSGLSEDTLEEGLSPDTPDYKKNMLLRMIFDKTCPMPGSEEVDHISEWISKTTGKPESHKDPYRSIFSASIKVRFLKSLLELNVGKLCEEHPSYMIGASNEKKELRLVAATSYLSTSGGTPFYYSFDIKGWSPNMPKKPQDMSHAIWDKMYGTSLFSHARKAMQGATVFMNQGGYKGWYVNDEANFEGYDGKEMTMLNVAMLALSVRVWREDTVVQANTSESERSRVVALLLAYIDDGMARIELPFDPVRSEILFNAFKRVCLDVFAKCGFVIEPAKCFPSDRFFIFLNESYLGGRHLVHGVRAAAQICSTAPEPHETLTQVVDKVIAGCRGAVMAGLDAGAATILMGFHLFEVLEDWVPMRDSMKLAMWTLAPRTWGGLGCPTMLQIGSNTSGNAHVEGITTMQTWARINGGVRQYYLNMMRTPMQVRTKAAILSAPFSLRVSSGYMMETRVPKAVRLALVDIDKTKGLGPVPREFMKFGDYEAFCTYAESVVSTEPGDAIQAKVLKDLYDSCPYAVYMSFCARIERGASVRRIIGAAAMRKIVRENRREARESYMVMSQRCNRIIE
jgi:hypothetical protein